jgi:DNA-binding NarL/FixJ family response regulator
VSGLRVLIADDHVPTRARVRRVLEQAGFDVCAEAASAERAVEAALLELPDICLIDVHMPGSGIAAAAEISQRLEGTAVVMLSVSHDSADASQSFGAGARGYLLKDMNPARIPAALRAAMRGELPAPDLP